MLDYKHAKWPLSYLEYLCLLFLILSIIFLRFQIKIEKMVDLTQLMENEVFMSFASYTTIMLSKMMFMSIVTGFYRMTRKVRNLEDIFSFKNWNSEKQFSLFFLFFRKVQWHIV